MRDIAELTEIVEWESYITGPRWALRDGTIRKGVIDWTHDGQQWVHGTEHAELIGPWRLDLDYERRTTGIVTATIFFKVTGKRWCVEVFQTAVRDAIRQYNVVVPV